MMNVKKQNETSNKQIDKYHLSLNLDSEEKCLLKNIHSWQGKSCYRHAPTTINVHVVNMDA